MEKNEPHWMNQVSFIYIHFLFSHYGTQIRAKPKCGSPGPQQRPSVSPVSDTDRQERQQIQECYIGEWLEY